MSCCLSFHRQHVEGVGVIGHEADGSPLCFFSILYLMAFHVIMGESYDMECEILHFMLLLLFLRLFTVRLQK